LILRNENGVWKNIRFINNVRFTKFIYKFLCLSEYLDNYEKKCVAYPQEDFLFTIQHRSSRRLKTNHTRKYYLKKWNCTKHSYGGYSTELAGSPQIQHKMIGTPNQPINRKISQKKSTFSTEKWKRTQNSKRATKRNLFPKSPKQYDWHKAKKMLTWKGDVSNFNRKITYGGHKIYDTRRIADRGMFLFSLKIIFLSCSLRPELQTKKLDSRVKMPKKSK
jgi:hypothetical protein